MKKTYTSPKYVTAFCDLMWRLLTLRLLTLTNPYLSIKPKKRLKNIMKSIFTEPLGFKFLRIPFPYAYACALFQIPSDTSGAENKNLKRTVIIEFI